MSVVRTDNLLRQSRLRRQLTLDEVSRRTKVPRPYVELVDEGRFGELPPGIYGRSYIRAFAAAVGLNGEEAIAQVGSELVEVPDPIPAIREIARERTAPTLSALIAERLREWYTTRPARLPVRVPGAVYLSASIDALLLFAMNAFIVGVAANACHATVAALLGAAGGAMAVVCGITSAVYFLLLGGVGGQTLGMRVFDVRLRTGRRPLDLRAVAGRTAEAFLGGGSVLVEWLCSSELPKRRESPV